MKQINDKLYINEDNVQGVQKLGDKYILTTTNGNNLMITESIYNDLKEYEGGGGGGTSYSAGAGIDITDGTISNTYADVIANPILAGTEADLTGLQVGDTKYVIPSGGSGSGTPLYLHNIFVAGTVGNTYIYAMTQVLSDSSLPFVNTADYVEGTNQKLAQWLYDKGFNDDTTIAKSYMYNVQYLGSTNRLGLISTDGSGFKVWKSGTGGYIVEAYSVAQVQDTVVSIGVASVDGSSVVANPTLEGTESDLEGIEIDGTKYKVGGGKKLYKHNIYFTRAEDNLDGMLTIINDSSTKLESVTNIATVLYNKGIRGTNKFTECNVLQLYSSKLNVFNRAYSSDTYSVTLLGRNSEGTSQTASISVYQTITDTVEEL